MPLQEGRHPGLVDPAVHSVPVYSRDSRIRLTSQLGLLPAQLTPVERVAPIPRARLPLTNPQARYGGL